jgi:hypothetical protein
MRNIRCVMVLNSREQKCEGEDTTDLFSRSTGQVRPLSIFICILFFNL